MDTEGMCGLSLGAVGLTLIVFTALTAPGTLWGILSWVALGFGALVALGWASQFFSTPKGPAWMDRAEARLDEHQAKAKNIDRMLKARQRAAEAELRERQRRFHGR